MKISKLFIISTNQSFGSAIESSLARIKPAAKIIKLTWEELENNYISKHINPNGMILMNLFEKFNETFCFSYSKFCSTSRITENDEQVLPPLNFLRSWALLENDSENFNNILPRFLFLAISDSCSHILSKYIYKPKEYILKIPFSIDAIIDKLETLKPVKFKPDLIDGSLTLLKDVLKPHGSEIILKEPKETTTSERVYNILLADDHMGRSALAYSFQRLLNNFEIVKEGGYYFNVYGEKSASMVLQRVITEPFDLIILDKQFTAQQLDGDVILSNIRAVDPVQPIIIFTGKYRNNLEASSRYGTQFDAAYFEKNKLLSNNKINNENLHSLVDLIIDRILSVRNRNCIFEEDTTLVIEKNGEKNIFSYEVLRWWLLRSVKEMFFGRINYCFIFLRFRNDSQLHINYKDVKIFLNKLSNFILEASSGSICKNDIKIGYGDLERSCITLIVPKYTKNDLIDIITEFEKEFFQNNNYSYNVSKSLIFFPEDLPCSLIKKPKTQDDHEIERERVQDSLNYILKVGRLVGRETLVGINEILYL